MEKPYVLCSECKNRIGLDEFELEVDSYETRTGNSGVTVSISFTCGECYADINFEFKDWEF